MKRRKLIQTASLVGSAAVMAVVALGIAMAGDLRLDQGAPTIQVAAGDVFWALSGPNYDGASFLHEVFRRGAQGAVAARPAFNPGDGWLLDVDDTQRALEQWARWKRRRFTGSVIAVTGSVGKTTTRQMIHTVLHSRLKGAASPRNYNNQWGVPLSMMTIEPDHDYAVLELGANRAGEAGAGGGGACCWYWGGACCW